MHSCYLSVIYQFSQMFGFNHREGRRCKGDDDMAQKFEELQPYCHVRLRDKVTLSISGCAVLHSVGHRRME